MPKTVAKLPHPPRGGRRRGSTYDRYLDGQVWSFTTSEMPPGGIASFRARFYSLAKRRGIRVVTEVVDGTVFVQAFPQEKT